MDRLVALSKGCSCWDATSPVTRKRFSETTTFSLRGGMTAPHTPSTSTNTHTDGRSTPAEPHGLTPFRTTNRTTSLRCRGGWLSMPPAATCACRGSDPGVTTTRCPGAALTGPTPRLTSSCGAMWDHLGEVSLVVSQLSTDLVPRLRAGAASLGAPDRVFAGFVRATAPSRDGGKPVRHQ